jgi:DNA repair protein RadA/Sms
VALAVASAARGVPLSGAPRACFGELGLTGELRWVGHPARRLSEAAKHGLGEAIAPPDSGGTACEVATLRQALAAAFAGPTGESAGEPLIARPRRESRAQARREAPSAAHEPMEKLKMP